MVRILKQKFLEWCSSYLHPCFIAISSLALQLQCSLVLTAIAHLQIGLLMQRPQQAKVTEYCIRLHPLKLVQDIATKAQVDDNLPTSMLRIEQTSFASYPVGDARKLIRFTKSLKLASSSFLISAFLVKEQVQDFKAFFSRIFLFCNC